MSRRIKFLNMSLLILSLVAAQLHSTATKALAQDELVTFAQQLTSDDPLELEGFGRAVGVSGNTLVVGAPCIGSGCENAESDSAYVFVRTGTVWELQQILTSDDLENAGAFGTSVAIEGDTVVIGARFADVVMETPDGPEDFTNAGAAYVFVRTGTVWELQQILTSDDLENAGAFGTSVAIEGDTIVVGAPFDDVDDISNVGSTSVFIRSGTKWTLQQKLTLSEPQGYENLGASVAISGNSLVAAAPSDTELNGLLRSAYVYVRSGTTWDFQQMLPTNSFGTPDLERSVAIDGDTIVVGAAEDEVGDVPGAGSALIFIRSGTVWSLQQRLTSDAPNTLELFGRSVALDGDTVVVGVPVETLALSNQVYVFVRTGTVWSRQRRLLSDDPNTDDGFGADLSIMEDTLVVGAWVDDVNNISDAGSAFVFMVADAAIKAEFESPLNGAVSGIALIRGWGYDIRAGDRLSAVDLYVDGERETSIACCSERKDVQSAFPDAPKLNTLNSGWGLTFNWGNIPAGLHTVRVDLESTSGATLSTVERAINVVKLGDFPFLDLFDLSNATVGKAGQELTLSGVQVRDKDSQAEKTVDATFQWMRAAQGFQLTDSTTLAQLTPPPSLLAAWWETLQHWFRGAALIPHALANPGLMHTFESPTNGPVSGITLVRGWAFETEASEGIEGVELFIDGQLNTTIACCSEREDVQAAFPQFPAPNTLNSGWGLTLNWGDLPAGEHEAQVVISSTTGGSVLSPVRTVSVIKPGGFSFLDSLDISMAVVTLDGQDVVLSGVVVEDSASEATATINLSSG